MGAKNTMKSYHCTNLRLPLQTHLNRNDYVFINYQNQIRCLDALSITLFIYAAFGVGVCVCVTNLVLQSYACLSYQ